MVSLFTIQKIVICTLSLQTVFLSGLFSTLRFCPWISGRGIVLKDMVLWCCQHLQVKKNKRLWGSMLSVGKWEFSGSLWKAAPSSGRLHLCILKWMVCCLWSSKEWCDVSCTFCHVEKHCVLLYLPFQWFCWRTVCDKALHVHLYNSSRPLLSHVKSQAHN